MFHADKPIDKKEFDCLNRTEFSKQLAKAILSYTKNDNLVISLYGKWGSGKTSILNMVIEEIGKLSNGRNEDETPIIIKFNPWNYSDCSQLINQFFVALQTQIKVDSRKKGLKAVGEALEGYSSLLDYSVYIPVIGPYLGPLKGVFAGIGKQIKKNVEKENNVEVKKKKVIEVLEKQKRKFIVIIDDIDRLNNSQIRAIFQLVNSLAGFPNMIYLLAFDREVVTRALQEEQKCDGEEYLEKIIQVPFEVPEVNESLINEVFFNRLKDIIFREENLNTNFDREYWEIIFSNCISPFIKSIRDVNRVINVFEFKYGLMHEEINVVDLLALTTLQVCASEIFRWIYWNASSLTGSAELAGKISGVEGKENYKKYMELFKVIYPENPQHMMGSVQTLFPKFSWRTEGDTYSRESNEKLRYNNRIASEDRIKRYFNLSLEEISVSKKQIEYTLTKYSKEQLKSYLMQLLKDGNLVIYLQELLAHIQDIVSERRKIFIDVLIEIQTLDEVYDRKNVLSPIPTMKCYYIMRELLKRDSDENNTILLQELIRNAEAKKLSVICRIVDEIEVAYGRKGNFINSSFQFIVESSLDEIESMILDKIKKMSESENYFDYKEVEYIYYLWRFLEKETLDLYMAKILQQPANIPKYLKLCTGTWITEKTSGWKFEKESFNKHIDKQEAYCKICSLKNTKEFSALNHSVKEIAIAFYIWCNKENCDYHDINKEEVNAVIPQWEINEK